MEVRFYRSEPESSGNPVQPSDTDGEGNPTVHVVCLERSEDPDANNHSGYDYWGVYGEDIDGVIAWEDKNAGVVTHIEYSELPDPVTFYPSPFSDVINNNSDGSVTYYVRSRDEYGRFVADDPSTPDVNEAWTAINN